LIFFYNGLKILSLSFDAIPIVGLEDVILSFDAFITIFTV